MYFGRYFYPFLLQQVTCDKKRDNFNDIEMPFATLYTYILFCTCLRFWKKFATGNDANIAFCRGL